MTNLDAYMVGITTEQLNDLAKRKAVAVTDNWKNSKTGMQCHRCMFWVRKSDQGSEVVIGRCRRNAPVMGEGWPVTYAEDWCGQFKLDEEKA